jgi:plasmid replication initiation protein
VRKHGGCQDGGWSFDLNHLHAKSGSLSPLKHFVYDLREIVRRQTLPVIGSLSSPAFAVLSVSTSCPFLSIR